MSTPTHDDEAPRPVATEPPRPRRFGGGVLAGVAGAALLVGAACGALLAGPVLGGGEQVGAEGDLRTACRYAVAIGDVEEGDIVPEEPMLWQLQAVASLAMASASAADVDEEGEDVGSGVFAALQRYDLDALNDALDDLRASCD